MQFATRTSRVTRIVAAVCAAGALSIGASACGGDDAPSSSDIVKAMKDGGGIASGVTDAQYTCAADVFKKYVKADVLKKAVDGDTDNLSGDVEDSLKNPDDADDFKQDLAKCLPQTK